MTPGHVIFFYVIAKAEADHLGEQHWQAPDPVPKALPTLPAHVPSGTATHSEARSTVLSCTPLG